LLLAFLVSVAVRLPSLNRPLSKHHEFNAAMVLVGCEGWAAAGGPQQVNFCPLINYANPGDVYYLQHPQVKDGKLHYLSFGPGQFLLPYYTGRLLHIPFTPLLLQIINLLLHLLSAWFVYRIVLLLMGNTAENIAKWAVLFFLFSAETLWFLGNGYVHESTVMPFFAAGLYFAVRFFIAPQSQTKGSVFLFGGIIFSGIFFDWLMLFFAAGVGLVALVRMLARKEKFAGLFVTTFIAAVAATGIVIWMYSSYYGADRFWALLLNKYETRNGLAGEPGSGSTQMAVQLLRHFTTGYLPLILLGGTALVLFFRRRIAMPKGIKILLLLHIPVFIYFLIFASFSAAHDYSVLKFSILFAVATAWLLSFILNNVFAKNVIAVFVIACSTVLYYYINPPGKKGFNGDAYSKEKNAGFFIKSVAQPDELVFHNMKDANWLAVYYYSKRNSMYMPDKDSAFRFFATTPAKKMVFINANGTMMAIRKD
jgi:hypothetical protein